MLHSEIIAVCSQIHTKHINTLCGQNVECRTYRAVNTLRLRYKNQPVGAAQWNNRCLFSDPHKTHKYKYTDWLVFITEKESVYWAERSKFYVLPTQCICVYLRTNGDCFTVQHWLVGFYNWGGVFTARFVLHSTFCPHSVFMCFVWIWEQTAIISLYSIDWLVFITET